MVDRGRVDCPVVHRKLSQLNSVVTHGGQAVTTGLPRKQHLSGLNIFLRDPGTAGGLGASWKNQKVKSQKHIK